MEGKRQKHKYFFLVVYFFWIIVYIKIQQQQFVPGITTVLQLIIPLLSTQTIQFIFSAIKKINIYARYKSLCIAQWCVPLFVVTLIPVMPLLPIKYRRVYRTFCSSGITTHPLYPERIQQCMLVMAPADRVSF